MGIPFQIPLGGEPLSQGTATVFAEAICSVPYVSVTNQQELCQMTARLRSS